MTATTGLELRDWFAGQVMTGMLANENSKISKREARHEELEGLARLSYQLADALLHARQAGETKGPAKAATPAQHPPAPAT